MRSNSIRMASFLLLAALFTTVASAQTSVAASIYGAFSGTTNGNGTQQSPANQAGGLFELRHISNPIFGFEATYSFNRADQTYTTKPGGCPAFGCSISTETVANNAHEITADWVPSVHIANFRPFGVLGVGLLLDVPANSTATVVTTSPCGATTCPASPGTTTTTTSSTSTSTKPVYVYGAGLDWGVLPHLGLRLQYRGNLYSAPNVTKIFSSTDTFTHTAEPMIGAYFNF
jgi:opacity protein-like surface antigen